MALKNAFQWLRSNISSVALAMLLGLTVWIIASQAENPVQEGDFQTEIPISVTGLGEGLIIANNYSDITHIRLRAQQDTWLSLSEEDILATIDLTGLGPGTYQVPIAFEIAARAFLVSANPSNIRIIIEEEREREIPVQVYLDGELSIGYSTGRPILSPAIVTVRGPRTSVQLVGEIRITVPIDGARDSVKVDATPVALDSFGNPIPGLSIEPGIIQVEVPITQDAGYRDIAIVARVIGQPAEGYYVTSMRVIPDLVTVRGEPEVISAMQPYVEIQPVNLSDLTDDLITEVTLDLPPGVTLVDTDTIRLLVRIQALQGSRSLTVPVQAVGLGEGFTVTFSPTTVTVILSGPLPVLDQLNPNEDVMITIDLTGLTVGIYQLEPTVEVFHSEVVVESIFPVVIQTTIEAE